jgi:hypothetical protein
LAYEELLQGEGAGTRHIRGSLDSSKGIMREEEQLEGIYHTRHSNYYAKAMKEQPTAPEAKRKDMAHMP